MALEYRIMLHEQPLVVYPRMGIIYVKDNARGHQMTSQFLRNIDVQMDLVASIGGSVRFKPYRQALCPARY